MFYVLCFYFMFYIFITLRTLLHTNKAHNRYELANQLSVSLNNLLHSLAPLLINSDS